MSLPSDTPTPDQEPPSGRAPELLVREGYRLTPAEIEALRDKSRKSAEWARQQLSIDPELKHLGPPGGWPDTAVIDKKSEESVNPEGAKRSAE